MAVPYITLFPVTVGVALFAGLGPSIVTGFLGTVLIDYLFLDPLFVMKSDVAHYTRLIVVVLTSAFVGYVGSVLRAARIKAERQARLLLESQEDLHRAQAVAHIGSWRMDVRRNELIWSEENHRIFGIPKGMPMTYETFLSTIHPDDREYVDTQWKAALDGKPYDIEHRIVIGGEVKWVRERAELEFDASGALCGGFGTTQDITERKQAEMELRQSERLYRGIGEAIDYGVWMCDADGRNIYASESFLKMVGITQQQCSDFGWGDVLHPDDAERTIVAWKECVRTGGNWDIEHRFRGVDGQWHYVLARGLPIRDEQGNVTCWAGINLDISDLKKAEVAMQRSETRYRRLFEAAKDGVLILNAATGQIIDVNPFLTELLGYSHKEFVEKHLWEIGEFKDIAASQEAFGGLQSKGYIRYEDLPLQTHDGRHIDVEFVSNRYSSGNIEVIQCNIRDITGRKQIDDTLKFLVRCGDPSSGEDFFQSLARYLGQSLGMDFVCIDRLQEGLLAAETVAIYFDGKFDPNVSYTLKDTPCGDVVGKTICCFDKGVRHLFPNDVVLQEMAAESYVGTTLWSSTGQPIGLIAVIGRKPLADTAVATSILQLVAVRAAAELERRQAENALANERINLQTIFDTVNVGMLLIDEQGVVQRSNNVASRWAKKNASAISVNKHGDVLGCIHAIENPKGCGHASECQNCQIRRALESALYKGQAVHTIETPATVWVDGKLVPLWLEVSADPLIIDGKACVILAMNDITGRKNAEEVLRKNELHERARAMELERLSGELEYKNEELESIIRIASHDLRSPLMNIKGFSNELSKDIDKVYQMLKGLPLPEKVGEKVEIVFSKYVPEAMGFIQGSADSISQMVKSLMAVAKAGTAPVRIREIDMNAMLAKLAANVQFKLKESGGTLTAQPLPGCRGDEDYITQIFTNLVENAIKYRDPARPCTISVYASVEADTARYCVEDNGKGIAP